MTAHYEKIMELWEAGKFFDAITLFDHWISGGLLSQEEIDSLNKHLAKFWELIEVECGENVEVMVTLYGMVKKARNWDDKMLSKKLKISKEAIEAIKNRYKPRSKAVGLKMLYELFPQMAV